MTNIFQKTVENIKKHTFGILYQKGALFDPPSQSSEIQVPSGTGLRGRLKALKNFAGHGGLRTYKNQGFFDFFEIHQIRKNAIMSSKIEPSSRPWNLEKFKTAERASKEAPETLKEQFSIEKSIWHSPVIVLPPLEAVFHIA